MIRFIFRTLILLIGNAVGLIVASIVLGGVHLGFSGFIIAVIIFTICVALLTPFLASTFRRGNNAALGGVSLISTLIALLITDIVSSGLSISGIGDWLAAAVIVWGVSLLAVFILPFLGLKKFIDERRA